MKVLICSFVFGGKFFTVSFTNVEDFQCQLFAAIFTEGHGSERYSSTLVDFGSLENIQKMLAKVAIGWSLSLDTYPHTATRYVPVAYGLATPEDFADGFASIEFVHIAKERLSPYSEVLQ